MKYGLQLVSNPRGNALSLKEAKLHLRVDNCEEDSLISSLIYAAAETVEGKIRKSMFRQTWQMTLDQFPYPLDTRTVTPSERDNFSYLSNVISYFAIELPQSKVVSVTSITIKTADEPVTLDSTSYTVDINSTPARIVPANGGVWPYVDGLIPGAIAITFDTGEWDAQTVPVSIKQAMLLLIGHWYINRESVTAETLKVLPCGVDSLLERWLSYA